MLAQGELLQQAAGIKDLLSQFVDLPGGCFQRFIVLDLQQLLVGQAGKLLELGKPLDAFQVGRCGQQAGQLIALFVDALDRG
ncbi:hypothetical protein D3C79_1004180 [compost metagenome]